MDPQGFDAIVSATASNEPLFTVDNWGRLDRPPLKLVDLALPYDSEPELHAVPWISRVDLSFFLAETDNTKVKRIDAAAQAEPFIVGAVERLRKRADTRIQKFAMRTAQERLTDAWEALEAEALAEGGVLGDLDPAQREALENLLKRGRTLAFRALNLQREPALEHH
jgi:glutamyl-tRNA reductase